MRLYLARHGDALDPEQAKAQGLDDRPLSDEGRADIERVAAMLDSAGIRVDKVFHSGKLRARQTAEILAAHLAMGPVRPMDGLKPNDPPEALAETVLDWSDDTLVVGHLPFMERALARMVSGDEKAAPARFATGAVACLERWESLPLWRLRWLVSPECVGS